MNQKIIILVTAIAILPFVQLAKAQQPAGKVPRIAYLTFGSSSSSAPRREAFREGLRKLNYIEGQNIIVEYRYADSKADLLAEQIAELIQLKVDVIVAGGTQANVEVKKATSTIPIVIANSDDPLGSGLVESLARPGGNATGLSSMSQELSGKRLELFKEVFPKVRRLAVLWHSTSDGSFKETLVAAQGLGFAVRSLEVKRPEDLDNMFATITKERLGWLVRGYLKFYDNEPKTDCGICRKAQTTGDLFKCGIRGRRWTHVVRDKLARPASACSYVRGQNLKRRQAC